MSAPATSRTTEPEFVHPGVFYSTTEDYLAEVGGFVREAVLADEPVMVAVPPGNGEVLRADLGELADEVEWHDMTRVGRNPGRILAALQDFADRRPEGPARIVGEPIWRERTSAELLEATKHEALINLAFAGRSATILCPYDAQGLPAAVLADARRTHPTLRSGGRLEPCAEYALPARVCADCDLPLPEPEPVPSSADLLTLAYRSGDLGQVRGLTEAFLRGTVLSGRRREDVLLAVNEAAANSLIQPGGHGTLRLWATPDAVIAETRDTSRPAGPLAGRRRPQPGSVCASRGLWLIHQLCDLVETRASETGLVLRLHFACR
ncbi:sensor histidine kinase [Phaeacidiphilus oryzae]|uniref:sensor histidine kinase n=1 Tax=Phaeacidiphilus oryzae TaxID=348818 RepID=UPI000567CD6B|nr:sensor histidine kinase [Phaeacidiphilus oryzae]